jgi:hypothetical protein
MHYPTEQDRMETTLQRENDQRNEGVHGTTLPQFTSRFTKIYRNPMVQNTDSQYMEHSATIMEAKKQNNPRRDNEGAKLYNQRTTGKKSP